MKSPFKCASESGYYEVSSEVSEQDILDMAEKLIRRKFQKRKQLCSSRETKQYLTIQMSKYEHEVFGVIFLDAQNRILSCDILFRGTIDGAAVYPREVVKQCLKFNAAATIFFHNHPSGIPEPSLADRSITKTLVNALNMIDVKVLDHLVVGGTDVTSFAERGLI